MSLALKPHFSKTENSRETPGSPLAFLLGRLSEFIYLPLPLPRYCTQVLCSVAFVFSRDAHELAGGLQAVGAPPKVDFLVPIDGLPGSSLSCKQEWTVRQS